MCVYVCECETTCSGALQIDGCPRGPFALLIQRSVVGVLTQI